MVMIPAETLEMTEAEHKARLAAVRADSERMAREINSLRATLVVIHEITQNHLVPAWQALENIAAMAAAALKSAEYGETNG
jgi:hypothetical protein